MAISSLIRSWLLLIPLIPSLFITIFNLYHLLRNRTLRIAVNNHVIILLLFSGFIEELFDIIPLIYFSQTGIVLSTTPQFCHAWIFLNTFGVMSINLLMCWASIERHILIFYSNLFSTRKKRFVFHYCPLIICLLWPIAFYLIVFSVNSCDILMDYNSPQCGLVWCILLTPEIAVWDSIAHYILPTFIIIIFSIALLLRVIYHKYQIHHRMDWRNYRKMAGQLLPISTLYFFLSFPPMILYAAYPVGLSTSIGYDYFDDALFFFYWVILFTPFMSIMSLPDLKTKLRNFFLFWKKTNQINPQLITMTRFRGHQTTAMPPIAH